MEKKFDIKEYKRNWSKNHKIAFKVDLNIDEYKEIDFLLKEKNITKAQFLRNAIKEFKKNY